MGEVVGIDLGTTNTVVAAPVQAKVTTLADDTGRKLLPSVVSFHPNGSVLVGGAAKDRRVIDAKNTVYSIKRLLGRSWDSQQVHSARARFPFALREGPGRSVLVVVRGQAYTLPEISALVLRKAKQIAEARLDAAVDRAVITVPANFNDLQRAATKLAGRIAGLEVLRVLNEPTAAALAYGHGRKTAERLAVYDLGGGTFDITLLGLSGRLFEVLATAGNAFLGGDDIDAAIAERMAESFLGKYRYDLRTSPEAYERLRAGAETIKLRLSHDQSASLELAEIAHGGRGSAIDFTFQMDRPELERLCAPFVDQSFEVCREALGIARLNPTDFDQVLLVGGSTRIPLVRRRVAEFFGREPVSHLSPDEVVAIGAGLQAAALLAGERRRSSMPSAARSATAGNRAQPSSDGPPLPPSSRRAAAARAATLPGLSDADDEDDVPTRIVASVAPGHPPPAPSTGAGRGSPARTQPLSAAPTLAGAGPHPPARMNAAAGSVQLPAEPPPLPTGEAAQRGRKPSLPPLPLVVGGSVAGPDPSRGPLPHPRSGRPTDTLSASAAALGDAQPAGARPEHSPPAAQRAQSAVGSGRAASTVPAHGAPAVAAAVAAAAAEASQVAPLPGASASLAAEPPAAAAERGSVLPKLVDVTPLGLCVETVGGFCDTIIERNTAVPCERSRVFVTAAAGQTSVRVRVAQGQSARFVDNVLLGQLELLGLAPAPRGQVQIEVTFSLDSSGMLDVRARDVKTGRSTSVQLKLEAVPDAEQLDQLRARHAALPTW
jgi:molecular chaperone DnaK